MDCIVCEWLGNNPTVSLALLIVFASFFAGALVAASRWRCPRPAPKPSVDEHAENLGIG